MGDEMIFASFFCFLCSSFSQLKMSVMIKASLDPTDPPPGNCHGSGLPSQPSTASPPAGWGLTGWLQHGKMAAQKAESACFFSSPLLGQRTHWRSIWPGAVLQPDHRHKLTTCALVHKPDKPPLSHPRHTWIPHAEFRLEKDKWKTQLWSNSGF